MKMEKFQQVEQAAVVLQLTLAGLNHEEREFLRKMGFSIKEQRFLREGTFRMIGFIRQFRGEKVGKPEKLTLKWDARK